MSRPDVRSCARSFGLAVGLPLVFLVATATWAQDRPRLPAPHQVGIALWETTVQKKITSKRSLVYHGWVTLSATILGFAIGTGLGILLAVGIERVVLRPLVGQPDIILFMATIGITLFLIGFGEIIFGGENKQMITEELGIPTGSITLEPWGGLLILEQKDITSVVVAGLLVVGLLLFLNKTRMGRAIRALGDDHQAAMSVGISLQTIWVLVWFIAGIIALVTGIAWGARAGVSFALEVIALHVFGDIDTPTQIGHVGRFIAGFFPCAGLCVVDAI